jgi:ABC-type uncharacterized transport system, permease component
LQQNLGGWLPSLSGALWASVAAAMILFRRHRRSQRHGWRLLPLLAIYGLVMAIGGALFATVPIEHLQATNSAAWLDLHIVVSVATYGLATIAAVAGIAVLLQERALKQKRNSPLLQGLPAVADGERLFTSLLAAAEVVLGVASSAAWRRISDVGPAPGPRSQDAVLAPRFRRHRPAALAQLEHGASGPAGNALRAGGLSASDPGLSRSQIRKGCAAILG